MMNDKALKLAPYGESSFADLRALGSVYADKTQYIEELENCGTRFPFMLRPRGFGKSVFADMLQAYYDKAAAGEFERNFSGTWIGAHPTPLARRFYVLKFDFSGIDSGEGLINTFILKVQSGMWDFVRRYFPDDAGLKDVLSASYASPSALLTVFLDAAALRLDGKIYLIIDEYDQAAQAALSEDPVLFNSMTRNDDFIKSFYADIKDYTQTLIARTFIAGETPVSLDSMTSGFNIAANITEDPVFAPMLGFTETDLLELIPQLVNTECCGKTTDEIFQCMKSLYGGYKFCAESEAIVFNPSMCLCYLSHISRSNAEPSIQLDSAVSPDLSKMNGILSLGSKAFAEEIVKSVIFDKPVETGGLSTAIHLSASDRLTNDDVLTALVFMGFLTFSPEDADLLVCPNRTAKDMFFKYYLDHREIFGDFSLPAAVWN